MTPDELKSIGCKIIHWNEDFNGGFFEYYLPITGNGRGIKDTRLSARIGEHSQPVVMLVLPQIIMTLNHVTTIEQFKQLYTLITGKEVNR